MTRAFLVLIANAVGSCAIHSSDEFCDRTPSLLSKRVLLEYYSRERIMSAEAKARFAEPDLQPLPESG